MVLDLIEMNIKPRKVAVVIGTNAELIKSMPLMIELQKKGNFWFIHTGQHNFGKDGEVFSTKKPDFILSEEPVSGTKFWSKIDRNSLFWFFSMIFKIRRTIKKINPKYVIYHGDTMSTAAAAIASSKALNPRKTWKNVHLEAGLRSGSILEPFPEEISRKISDKFSDILLAVSEMSKNNLEREKSKGKIILTGNTVVDSANMTYEKAKKVHQKYKEDYVLINLHRHENLVSLERMKKIVNILGYVKSRAIWPMHENTRHYLEKYNLMKKIKEIKNIEITPLVDYSKFIFLIANCKYLVTDGGSIQEESLVFGKPCVILRKRTERQEGLATGINFLTKLEVEKTKEILEFIESGKMKIKKFENPYGECGLSKKIAEILK